jgi:hypothetical protein
MNIRDRTHLFTPWLVIVVCAVTAATAGAGGKLGSVGIYVYENLEGAHTPSSASGTRLAALLASSATQVLAVDKVPLVSNESVRILDKLTEDRKIVVAAVHTWFTGNVIAAPTITLADDAIKFQDLTWHVDRETVLVQAAKDGQTQALIGTATGLIKEAGNRAAQSGSKLRSVTVEADFQLIDVRTGAASWAQHFRVVNAGFDPRVAFDDGLTQVAELAAKELQTMIIGKN